VPPAQAKIEEAIRKKNVDENYEAAMEHNPEVRAGGARRGGADEACVSEGRLSQRGFLCKGKV
jgi:hypothetical protein